jgi:hypothetical protein
MGLNPEADRLTVQPNGMGHGVKIIEKMAIFILPHAPRSMLHAVIFLTFALLSLANHGTSKKTRTFP